MNEKETARLKAAVEALYYGAYWASDRLPLEKETELWTELRDAAKLEKGQTSVRLGPAHWTAPAPSLCKA